MQGKTPSPPGHPFSDRQLRRLLAALDREPSFVLLESSRITPDNYRSFLFRQPVAELRLDPGLAPAAFFRQAEAWLARGYYLAGWLAYEFGYLLEPRLAALLPAGDQPLAILGVFPPPQIYDHRQPTDAQGWPLPAADEDAETAATDNGEPACAIADFQLNESEAQYLTQLARIKEYIAAGDTYQVNYTLKMRFKQQGAATGLYTALRRNQRVPYSAFLRLGDRQALSFSPELFFRKEGQSCTVRPMKGTSRRGLTPAEDARRAATLAADPKNRSENVMIVDLLRNDLGRICLPGSVRADALFQVETYETLHQMTSTISGQLQPKISLFDLFHALFPCGSVTGAPKIRTMEIIRELEREARGVYTGAIGFIGPGGKEAVFSVPIRTVTLDSSEGDGRRAGEMGIGSGVVDDSDPAKEWRECLLKGDFLRHPTPAFALIETILWQPEEGYALLPIHLTRLLESAAFLGFYADPDEIRNRLTAIAATFNQPQRVRLTLAKDGAITIQATPCPAAAPLRNWPPPAAADEPAGEPPRLLLSPHRIDPNNPLLYHKTTCRELYDQERQAALATGGHEVFFLNLNGEVTEGAISNIFIEPAGGEGIRRLLTPPVAAGLLNGVLRRQLLTVAPDLVREAVLRPADLRQAAAIYIGNSVRGLVRVRLDER